jgi:hypothetical protein
MSYLFSIISRYSSRLKVFIRLYILLYYPFFHFSYKLLSNMENLGVLSENYEYCTFKSAL